MLVPPLLPSFDLLLLLLLLLDLVHEVAECAKHGHRAVLLRLSDGPRKNPNSPKRPEATIASLRYKSA